MPLMPGKPRSSKMRSGDSLAANSTPSSPSKAVKTLYPSLSSTFCNIVRMDKSSSVIRILCFISFEGSGFCWELTQTQVVGIIRQSSVLSRSFEDTGDAMDGCGIDTTMTSHYITRQHLDAIFNIVILGVFA